MDCKNCGAVREDGYKFCKNCGTPFDEGSTELVCTNCGKTLGADAAFCPFCGTSVKTQAKPVSEGSVKPAKPVVMSNKAANIITIVKAWVFVALFLLMFGLSFLSFIKVDLYDEFGFDEGVRVSAVDVLEAALGKKEFTEDIVKELKPKLDKAKDESAKIRIVERYNPLKIVFSRDVIDAAPFSSYFSLVTYATLVFALMFGSFTFAVLFLIQAIFLTTKGRPAFEKDISGLGFGIMTALALLSMSFTAGEVGGGPLAAMIIGFCGLGLTSVFNAVICKKRPPSVKRLVTQCISLALGITLLFTLTAGHYGVKAEVKQQSSTSDRIYTKVVKSDFGFGDFISGLDIFAAEEGNMIYFGDKLVEDIDETLLNTVSSVGEEALMTVAPPMLYFYGEMSSGYNAAGLVLGILSSVFYYASSISLAVMLGFVLTALSNFDKRTGRAANIVAFGSFLVVLTTTIIGVATAASIIKSLSLSFKVYLCAAPIVNVVLGTGLLVQNLALAGKEKSLPKTASEN